MKKTLVLKTAILMLLGIGTSCKKTKEQPAAVAEVESVDYLNESEESFNQRMKWWRDSKFGMFIHWGPYALFAGEYDGKEVKGIGEWIMQKAPITIENYEATAKNFNPIDFDAKQWAKIMKEAGMKYVVITSKHHDGFAMWDSEVSDYNIVDFTPFKRDVLAELSKACKDEGIKFGLYYSIMDWHHPDAQGKFYPKYNLKRGNKRDNPTFPNYYTNYMKPQLKELIKKYDPEILWFDGEWFNAYTHEMGLELYQYLRELKPSLIINNRIDKGRAGMKGMNRDDKEYVGDFGTPEQEILQGTSDMDWESCMTINDTWGYKKNDNNWKSSETLIHNLIDVAAKGGNYLLNVGPTAQGLIPMESVDRIKEMGAWLDNNGEAIYETERLVNNYKQGDHIRFTKKKGENKYYVFCFETHSNEISIENIIPEKGSEIILLESKQALDWEQTPKNQISIKIPFQEWNSDKINVIVLEIQGKEILSE